jgi:signal transduction histidine kinase
MRTDRALRLAGWGLVLVAGETGWVQPFCFDPTILAWWRFQGWCVSYAALAIAFHACASAPDVARRRILAGLAGVTAASLVMQAMIPCEFGAVTVLLVASQSARVLTRRHMATLVALHAAVTGLLLTGKYGWLRGVSHSIALLAGGLFAGVAVYLARRAQETARDLADANTELKAARALLEETSRARERTRIARELHDVLGHDLTALGLQLEVATHVPPDRAAAHVAKAQEVGARLLRSVREVAADLRDQPPADLGRALRTLVEDVPGLTVHLDVPDDLCVGDGARGQCILRCVQEIVTNAMRHARASNLWITIAVADGAITLEARDDGRGATEVRAGQGLSGMRARVEELGGRLRVAAEPARAFAVSAWLPAKEEASLPAR